MSEPHPIPPAFRGSTAALVTQLRANIAFRFFDTRANVPNKVLIYHGAEFGIDLVNTVVNDRSPVNADMFLARMPRMSTLANGYLINGIVRNMSPHCAYLNIGVWRGFTFFSGLVGNADKICIGVDNFSQFGGPRDHFLGGYERYKSSNSAFFDMDYEVYFDTQHRAPIGLYYYDGDHEYKHQLHALEVVERFLAPDALIIVDDTNIEAVRGANLDFMASRPGKYQIVLDEPTFGNFHPTFWNGLMIIGRTGA
jgi:hypothetical protein